MADLAESPVAVVMVEQAGQRLELYLEAIKTHILGIETLVARVCRVIDVVADEQVEPAVIVIVEPSRRTRPAGIHEACFLGDVPESPIPVIVVENVPSISG